MPLRTSTPSPETRGCTGFAPWPFLDSVGGAFSAAYASGLRSLPAAVRADPDLREPEGVDFRAAELRQTQDEKLVELATRCACRAAVHELILRYHDWMNRLIARQGRRLGLRWVDIQDAQQEAVFAMMEAVAKYDPYQHGKVRRCGFHTFLQLVLTARLKDFAKHLRRVESRYDRSLSSTLALEGTERDPTSRAEWNELMARLQQALDQLDDGLRRLWEQLLSGFRLRVVADQLGMSYHMAKRRRQKLLHELRARLR
jgi:RNA polymerase sigma factor (sigma-70 family)